MFFLERQTNGRYIMVRHRQDIRWEIFGGFPSTSNTGVLSKWSRRVSLETHVVSSSGRIEPLSKSKVVGPQSGNHSRLNEPE